jgi:secreted PhoX family phosphatase
MDSFDASSLTAAEQERRFGYNCDYVGFLPLPFGTQSSERGLLVVNHEYTNPELMFPAYDPKSVTADQVAVQAASVGLTVAEIRFSAAGGWTLDVQSKLNRRISFNTEMAISGPAAGAEWMKTSADPQGRTVIGTTANCSAGKTPWGTVLSAEENFQDYFANLSSIAKDDPRRAVHERYGVHAAASEYRWEIGYERCDLKNEPNEPFRFGWVVEVDPYEPDSKPVKRTALGRFRHEAATTVVTKGGRVALYSGDDAMFEYVYKFVTSKRYDPKDRKANRDLLDDGVLYCARFDDDGGGEWLPLVHGHGPLTAENGFGSQADVLINTRRAADLLGATKMDRPEDIEANPVNNKVYLVLTKNSKRGAEGNPTTNKANPRSINKHGHIIELTEEGDDHAATRFTWDIFLLCGDPKEEDTYFAGFDKSRVSMISSPDNIAFDLDGNMWIATDGQPSALKVNDGLFAVPIDGENRGYLRQFFSSAPASEVCGPEFTPDCRNLFLAIQHPGEGSTFEKPSTSWPGEQGPPRPSVIVIRAADGGVIGSSGDGHHG